MRFLVLLLFSTSLLAAQPSTTNNNDSCDISLLPAATLLLPYFEVDTAAPQGTGTTTLFTITNTSRYPQIAHVTVWTDWSFPVLTGQQQETVDNAARPPEVKGPGTRTRQTGRASPCRICAFPRECLGQGPKA